MQDSTVSLDIFELYIHVDSLLLCSAGFAIEAVSSNMVYKLSPFDLVLVSVYGQQDLHSEQRISDQGHLLIPLLGGSAGRRTHGL